MAECMTFPKTVDEFIEQCSFKDDKQEYTNGSELIAVFRVKQMMEHYFAKDTNVPSWIPVTERLPEKDGDYLVFKVFDQKAWCDVISFAKDGRKVSECTFGKKWQNIWYYYDSEWGYIRTDSVTHWMPLPEPPKEG